MAPPEPSLHVVNYRASPKERTLARGGVSAPNLLDVTQLAPAARAGKADWNTKLVARKPRVEEKAFLARVTSTDGFWRAVGGFSKSQGVAQDEAQRLAVDIARNCWSEAGELMLEEAGPLAKAKAEIEQMKAKHLQCQLAAIKQASAAKVGTHIDAELADDAVTFYEPLQFLDADTKDLVLRIVNEKMRLLEFRHAPPSLVEALVRSADAVAAPTEAPVDAEELKELRAELAESRAQHKMTRRRLDEAEEKGRKWEGLLAQEQAKTREVERVLAEVREQEAALRAAHEELQKVSERQQAEIQQQQAEIQRQLVEIERQKAELQEQRLELERQRGEIARQRGEIERLCCEIERLKAEVEKERHANAELRTEIGRLKEKIREYACRVEKLEQDLQEMTARFQALEKEAKAMRDELARRNNTRTHGTQTSLTGPQIDEKTEEIKRLKLMMEELQMKMKELMDQCRRKFGGDVKKMAADLGLDELMKEHTVFQRLYDDALDRVDRLEKLRDKIRRERRPAGHTSPRSAAMVDEILASPEQPVLEAVQQSRLPGMRRFAVEAARTLGQGTPQSSPIPQAGYPSASPHLRDPSPPVAPSAAQRRLSWDTPDGRPSLKESGCGDGDIYQQVQAVARPLRSTASLPALMHCSRSPAVHLERAPGQTEASVLTLELGGPPRRRKIRF